MRMLLSTALLMSLALTTSCTSLNKSQQHELSNWEGQNLKREDKNETLAAGLNVLPGIGDFYNGNIGLGIVNLLAWPASILWAPVGGMTGAEENNYFATKTYVEDLTRKRQIVENDLQAAVMTKRISHDEYFIASQKVKTMNLNEFNKSYSVQDFVPRMVFDPTRIPSSDKK